MINGMDELAITKLDVLDTIDELKVCVAYKLHGKTIDYPITDARELEKVEPVYESFSGWNCNTTGARTFADLPIKVKDYLKFIEKFLGDAGIKIISVGQERDRTILL